MENMGRQSDLQIINGRSDQDFASLMISHHQSATETARLYLIKGTDTQLKAMAEKMITDQEKEIKELQEWLMPYKRK